MPVQHFTLDSPNQSVRSTYLSHLSVGTYDDLMDHPGSYTVRGTSPLTFQVYHGRLDPDADMDDWGFEGPSFGCLNIVHDPDRILLQHCDAQSLELAKRLGLTTANDTIAMDYLDDMVVIPQYRDGQPAYFGDHSATLTPGAPDARRNSPADHPQERGELPTG